jgi:hypothetical protein
LIADIDTIDKGSKQGGVDTYSVTNLVSETLPGLFTILDRGEHGTKKEHQPIWILMMISTAVLNQFYRIPAYILHGTFSFQPVTLRSVDSQADLSLTDIVKTELTVKQPDKGPNCTGSIVRHSYK